MTDDAATYITMGREFADHSSVNHSADEYVRKGGFVHTNTVENFFSIVKRGVTGTFHHVSEAHLPRYLVEFDFRHNTRTALGFNDDDRAAAILRGAEGKRLMYRQPVKPHTPKQKARRLIRLRRKVADCGGKP